MLTEMLKDTTFETPAEKQITLTLANIFQSSPDNLFKDPRELYETTGMGTTTQWQKLLNMIETQNYIKGQLAFYAQVSQRKTFASLVSMALQGNQQAAKQVQELSGVLNQQDTNRTIILHHIPRANQHKEVTQ